MEKFDTKNKLKVAVYTIAKNEAIHARAFADSVKDADEVLVLDTGSTDETIELLHDVNVVQGAINPWRYDHARNFALNLVGDVDVCIAMDMDEVLVPNWRSIIESIWTPTTAQLSYKFRVSNVTVFYNNKIHARHGFFWDHPVHECLKRDVRTVGDLTKTDEEIILHRPLREGNTAKHLEMLSYAVKQYPDCGRMCFYYARDLFNAHRWQECADAFDKYLDKHDSRKGAPERCYAWRLTARCMEELKRPAEAAERFLTAIHENPEYRDNWMMYGHFFYRQCKYAQAYAMFSVVPTIEKNRSTFGSDDTLWGAPPYDWAALAASRAKLTSQAVVACSKALEYEPENQRLLDNLRAFSKDLIPKA
jgi:glycosyltransferase involved in cell wall biosynthesis